MTTETRPSEEDLKAFCQALNDIKTIAYPVAVLQFITYPLRAQVYDESHIPGRVLEIIQKHGCTVADIFYVRGTLAVVFVKEGPKDPL